MKQSIKRMTPQSLHVCACFKKISLKNRGTGGENATILNMQHCNESMPDKKCPCQSVLS